MKLKMLGALPGILCLLTSITASALALSDIELRSRLNQPLDARIRLVSLSQAELDSLTVSIQPGAGSEQAVGRLQQEIQQDENGHFLIISTGEPVREPVLTLVIEMSWSTGHLTREYALIVDPG